MWFAQNCLWMSTWHWQYLFKLLGAVHIFDILTPRISDPSWFSFVTEKSTDNTLSNHCCVGHAACARLISVYPPVKKCVFHQDLTAKGRPGPSDELPFMIVSKVVKTHIWGVMLCLKTGWGEVGISAFLYGGHISCAQCALYSVHCAQDSQTSSIVLDASGCWMSRVLDIWVLDVPMPDVCESCIVGISAAPSRENWLNITAAAPSV